MWVSRKEFKALSDRVYKLESTVDTLDYRTGDYPVYSSDLSKSALVRVPLWDMIIRILRYLELDTEAKPKSWELVKIKPSKKAK